MKKLQKIILIFPIIMLLWISMYGLYYYLNIKKYEKFNINEKPKEKDLYEEKITYYRQIYNNEDVIATVSIENSDFNTVVMQGKDNDYYLNHLPDKSYSINGSIFLDYRVDIEKSNILLIFGHSSPSYYLPIMILENYNDENYYKQHKYIYLSTIKEIKKYEIFSAYVETSDWDYMNINYNNDENYLNHLKKLKSKSFYDTNVNITKDDEILIMQTCSNLEEYSKYNKKYMLVIAKKVNN